LSADDCREIVEVVSKARVLANEGTQNEIQQTLILAFITDMVILIAIIWVS